MIPLSVRQTRDASVFKLAENTESYRQMAANRRDLARSVAPCSRLMAGTTLLGEHFLKPGPYTQQSHTRLSLTMIPYGVRLQLGHGAECSLSGVSTVSVAGCFSHCFLQGIWDSPSPTIFRSREKATSSLLLWDLGTWDAVLSSLYRLTHAISLGNSALTELLLIPTSMEYPIDYHKFLRGDSGHILGGVQVRTAVNAIPVLRLPVAD